MIYVHFLALARTEEWITLIFNYKMIAASLVLNWKEDGEVFDERMARRRHHEEVEEMPPPLSMDR